MEPTPLPFMTINEFCAWTRLGRTKTYELLKSRELAAIKVGNRTLIPGEAAQAWLASQPHYRPESESSNAKAA